MLFAVARVIMLNLLSYEGMFNSLCGLLEPTDDMSSLFVTVAIYQHGYVEYFVLIDLHGYPLHPSCGIKMMWMYYHFVQFVFIM